MPVSPQDHDHPDEGGQSGQDAAQEHQASASAEPAAQGVEISAPEEEEEAQEQKAPKVPEALSPEDMEEHRANGHLPYRSGCPDCVEPVGHLLLLHPCSLCGAHICCS